jgi:hypothetical protein
MLEFPMENKDIIVKREKLVREESYMGSIETPQTLKRRRTCDTERTSI